MRIGEYWWVALGTKVELVEIGQGVRPAGRYGFLWMQHAPKGLYRSCKVEFEYYHNYGGVEEAWPHITEARLDDVQGTTYPNGETFVDHAIGFQYRVLARHGTLLELEVFTASHHIERLYPIRTYRYGACPLPLAQFRVTALRGYVR